MKTSKQQRSIIFKYLPETIKSVFHSDETTQKLKQVGEKYELTKQDSAKLGEAVGLVLLGIKSRKGFQNHLYECLSVEKSAIDNIIKATQSIFQPIAGQLEELDASEILKKAEKARKMETGKSSMPIPPPPPVPGSGYGGTSDPYREPTESN